MYATKLQLVSFIAIALVLTSISYLSLSATVPGADAQTPTPRTITLFTTVATVAEDVGDVEVALGIAPLPTDGSWSSCGLRVLSADLTTTATENTDFALETNSKTLDSMSNWTATTTIAVINDSDSEVDETVNLEAFCAASESGTEPPADGLQTESLSLTITDDDPPAAPSIIAVTPGHKEITSQWTDPGDATITKYQYRVSIDGGGNWSPDWTDIPNSDSSTTQFNITGLSVSQEYTVEIRAVAINEVGAAIRISAATLSPAITGLSAISYAENGIDAVETYAATGLDSPVAWSLEGDDKDMFMISGGGDLDFVSAPDYENPSDTGQDNSYNIVVVATSTGAPEQRATLSVSVTVTDVNEPPAISGSVAYSLVENVASPTVLGIYSAQDPEGNAFTWSLEGADSDIFAIDNLGSLSFERSPDYENPIDSDSDNIYEVTIVAAEDASPAINGELDVRVNIQNFIEVPGKPTSVSASPSADNPWSEVVVTWTDPDMADKPPISRGVISYMPTGQPSSVDIAFSEHLNSFTVRSLMPVTRYSFQVSLGNSDGFGEISDAVEASTQLANPAPTITGRSAISFPENGTSPVETYVANERVTWSLEDTDDDDEFDLSSQGVLTFKNPPDFENPDDSDRDNVYEITISATDQGEPARTVLLNVRVKVVNETLALNHGDSTAEEIVREGNVFVGEYDFDQGEGDSIAWKLLGDDAWLFEFSERSRNRIRVYFDRAPDFEYPRDEDANNVYEFTLRGTDNGNPRERAELDFEIAVINLVERTPTKTPSTSTPTKTPNKRPSSTPAPRAVNPPGKIPSIIVGPNAEIYEVFTPVDGGTYQTDEYRIHAGPGSVPNGTLIGIRIYSAATDPSQIRHPN